MTTKLSRLAFAVAQREYIDVSRIEEYSDEGRAELIRTLNRPAGERVIVVEIRETPDDPR